MSSTIRAAMCRVVIAAALTLALQATALARAPSTHAINATVHMAWTGGRGGGSIFTGEVVGRPFPSLGTIDAKFTPGWPAAEPPAVRVVYTLFFTNGSLRGVVPHLDLTHTVPGPPDPFGPRRAISGTATRIFAGTGAFRHAKGNATIAGWLQSHGCLITLKGSVSY